MKGGHIAVADDGDVATLDALPVQIVQNARDAIAAAKGHQGIHFRIVQHLVEHADALRVRTRKIGQGSGHAGEEGAYAPGG